MPTATHETITNALKTVAQGLSGIPTVVVRAEAWLIEGEVGAVTAMLILTMGNEREGEQIIGGARYREYDVVATFCWVSGFRLETNIATAKAWREAVKKRWEPDYTATPGSILAGVASVWDIDAVDLPPEESDKFAVGYEVERLGVTVHTNEATHA